MILGAVAAVAVCCDGVCAAYVASIGCGLPGTLRKACGRHCGTKVGGAVSLRKVCPPPRGSRWMVFSVIFFSGIAVIVLVTMFVVLVFGIVAVLLAS